MGGTNGEGLIVQEIIIVDGGQKVNDRGGLLVEGGLFYKREPFCREPLFLEAFLQGAFISGSFFPGRLFCSITLKSDGVQLVGQQRSC